MYLLIKSFVETYHARYIKRREINKASLSTRFAHLYIYPNLWLDSFWWNPEFFSVCNINVAILLGLPYMRETVALCNIICLRNLPDTASTMSMFFFFFQFLTNVWRLCCAILTVIRTTAWMQFQIVLDIAIMYAFTKNILFLDTAPNSFIMERICGKCNRSFRLVYVSNFRIISSFAILNSTTSI